MGLLEAWYAHRTACITDIARDWLEAEGIPYVEG